MLTLFQLAIQREEEERLRREEEEERRAQVQKLPRGQGTLIESVTGHPEMTLGPWGEEVCIKEFGWQYLSLSTKLHNKAKG